MTEIRLGEVTLELHASGAVHDPLTGRLFLADLHLGKGATLRAAGVPVPEGTSVETMRRVSEEVVARGPGRVREVWVLGDLVHHRTGIDAGLRREVADWIGALPGARLHLVRGNHDRSAGPLPDSWAVEVHDEPHDLGIGGATLRLLHDPGPGPGSPPRHGSVSGGGARPGPEATADPGATPALAGHLHPMVRVGRGRTRTPKLPAFLGRESAEGTIDLLVLPAAGRLVDGAATRGGPGWRAWVCAEEKVQALPSGSW